jgi:hypothetical protein
MIFFSKVCFEKKNPRNFLLTNNRRGPLNRHLSLRGLLGRVCLNTNVRQPAFAEGVLGQFRVFEYLFLIQMKSFNDLQTVLLNILVGKS